MNLFGSKKTELFIMRLVMLCIVLSIFALILVANPTKTTQTPSKAEVALSLNKEIVTPAVIKIDPLIQQSEKLCSDIECEYDYELKALRASTDNVVALREQLVTYINEKDFEKRNDTVPLHKYVEGMKIYKKELNHTCKRLCRKRKNNTAAHEIVTKINNLCNDLTELEACLKKHKDFIQEARFLKTQKSDFEKIFGPLSSASKLL